MEIVKNCLELSQKNLKKVASNITIYRASSNEGITNEFFDNLVGIFEMYGLITPGNIYNYNETNQRDDPGSKDVLVLHELLCVENVAEHSMTMRKELY